MEPKSRLDTFGIVSLVGFSLLLGLNQVLIKVTNDGLQPIFFAGLRSLAAIPLILLWMRVRGLPVALERKYWLAGSLMGLAFSAEFLCLFLALDLTTVTRVSVIFYSMPVWFALAAHVVIPGERITGAKAAGLLIAFAGVAWAIIDRPGAAVGEVSLLGDLLALGAAFGWAAIALVSRGTNLREVRPEVQLLYQLIGSALILLALAPLFGPFVREFTALHGVTFVFQVVVIVAFSFPLWLWFLSIYPPSSVAAFSFLSPVFGVALGWLLLGEEVNASLLLAAGLVVLGLALINRPKRA